MRIRSFVVDVEVDLKWLLLAEDEEAVISLVDIGVSLDRLREEDGGGGRANDDMVCGDVVRYGTVR
jgi:hypothetical protein